MEQKKTLADTFLSINKLNKQKLNILLKMMELEEKQKQDSEEYITCITYYELICSIYTKYLTQLTETECSEILELIHSLNPNIFQTANLKDTLNLESQALALKKTTLDLGVPLVIFYKSDSHIQSITQMLSQLFGIMETEPQAVVNERLVNSYMISDFMNVTYHSVQEIYHYPLINDSERKMLLLWKYKLIFLSEDIETTGLTEEEYNSHFDSEITNAIMKLFPHILNKITASNAGKIDLCDLISLKSMLSISSNKHICNIFELANLEEVTSDKKRSIDIIKQILKDAQKPEYNYQKQRKYFTI